MRADGQPLKTIRGHFGDFDGVTRSRSGELYGNVVLQSRVWRSEVERDLTDQKFNMTVILVGRYIRFFLMKFEIYYFDKILAGLEVF